MSIRSIYKPEGQLISTYENRELISGSAGLEKAAANGTILEAVALMCDESFNLHFDLHGTEGIMPRDEAMLCRDGEQIKDIAILTRVGKPVCFKIKKLTSRGGKSVAILSRKDAQLECAENYLSDLRCGDIIPARVTHLESFGAFVDIGCGIASLLSVDSISVSRISHPRDRLSCGMNIFTVVKSIDRSNGRIFVSQRELLGTWEENAAEFSAGQTVAGTIRSIENYGIFVELTPNLAGLAEFNERCDCKDPVDTLVGQKAAVYIKSIIPERMKIKLVIIDICRGEAEKRGKIKYFVDCDNVSHMDYWRYSPELSGKVIDSVF